MSNGPLDTALRRTGKAALLSELLRALSAAVAAMLVTVLLAVALDAALALEAWALIGVDCVMGVVAAGAMIYIAWVCHCNAYDPRRIARLVEDRLGVEHNRLINAIDLADQPAGPTSQALRETALSRGGALAGAISSGRVIDRRRLKRSAGAAAAAALAVLIGAAIAPGVFSAAMRRYANPAARHAPFTLVEFDVSVEPATVYRGQGVVITSTLTSSLSLPDQADVVFIDADAGGDKVAPMLRESPGRFVLRIERAERSCRFFIRTPAGRSGIHQLNVRPLPDFSRVRVGYKFPAYTQWPHANAVLADNCDIRAIEGTMVTLTVTGNQPLRSATMVISGLDKDSEPESLVLSPTRDPTVVGGTFELTSSGRYELSLINADGVAGARTVEGAVTCVPDSPPGVSIVSPGRTVVAPEHWKVNVSITARDDVGVRRLVLHRGINGWGPVPVDLKLNSSGTVDPDAAAAAPVVTTYATAACVFDLPALGARPGDVITYHVSAHDVHPRADHFSTTPTSVIRVISKQEYIEHARTKYRLEQMRQELAEFRRIMEQVERQRRELLKEFEQLESKARSGKLSKADLAKLAEVVRKQKKYADATLAAAAKMKERTAKMRLYEFEPLYTDLLSRMADKLAQRAAATSRLASSYPQPNKPGEHIDKSIEQLRRDEGQGEQIGEDIKLTDRQLELLLKADEMSALVEQLTSIAGLQRDLADRLGAFRNKEELSAREQIIARRIAQEQGELRLELQRTMDKLRKKALAAQEDLPKMSSSAIDLVDAITDLDVLRDQHDAASLAEAGLGRYAHRSATDAATKLESLIEQCCPQGGAAAAVLDLDRALKMAKGAVMAGLQQLAASRGIPGMGKGGSGSGYYGSRGEFSLAGPHSSGNDSGEGDAGSGRGRRPPRKDSRGDEPGAESLAPAGDVDRGGEARAMPGVPARYRDLAESYFRRLADDSK